MQFMSEKGTLVVAGLARLTSSEVVRFRRAVQGALRPEHSRVDIDMSRTQWLDAVGLAELLVLARQMKLRGGRLRISAASRCVEQMLEFTRMHCEIVLARRSPCGDGKVLD